MKTKSLITKIMLLTVFSFSLSYLAGNLSDTNHSKFFPLAIAEKYSEKGNLKLETIEIQKSVDLKDLNKISIETVATDIAVELTKTDKITIVVKGRYPVAKVISEKLLQIESKDGKLTVLVDDSSESSTSGLFNMNISNEGKLTLLLPEQIKNAEVTTVSGNIKFKDNNLTDLVVKSVSGDFLGENLTAKTFKLSTVSGDVITEGAIEKIKSKSVSGDFKVKSILDSASIELATTSGDAEVLFKSQPNAKIDFSSVSGDINISKALSSNKAKGTVEDAEFDSATHNYNFGSGKGLIKVNSVSGDLSFGIY
jgi:DUF4097 and DUF4098 domain-containing protein YvlB